MNGLRAYRDRRLELGDMIRAALHVARASGDQLAEKRSRELLARLAADRFELAVVGQFSRGKTTLMNTLLGGPYLPMGALPMTSVITTVRFGSRPRAIVYRRASPLPVQVPLTEAGFLADAASHVGRRRSAVADKIADRIDAGLPELLAARSRAWQASLRDLIEPRVGHILTVAGSGTVRGVLEDARGKLEEAGREIAGAWMERRVGEVQELLTGLAAGEIGELLEISRSPGAAGAGIAGLAADKDRRELAGWSAEDVPALAAEVPQWAVPVHMPRRSRRKADASDGEVRRYLEDALTVAIVACDERARVEFQEAARDWARRLDDEAGRQMREEADRFRRLLQTVPRDEELVALDNLAGRLAGFQAALGEAEPPGPGSADAELIPAANPSADGCVVCEQMQATLTGYLRRSQFRLATREADQQQHALLGGFCPLHTWQYAAIASPLGISAGYPKLAAAVADALESISEHDGTVADLAGCVVGVAPQPGTCPLCAALAERERDAVSDVVSQALAAPTAAALCLRHLALALAASPPPDAARAMVRALADALRRDGDDMRAYALKREGLHSGLVTEEESRAYLGALRRLAGLPALTQTWPGTEA